jgi:hypothetical protein
MKGPVSTVFKRLSSTSNLFLLFSIALRCFAPVEISIMDWKITDMMAELVSERLRSDSVVKPPLI